MDTRIAAAALSVAFIPMASTASAQQPPTQQPAAVPGEQPVQPCGRSKQPDDDPCGPNDERQNPPPRNENRRSDAGSEPDRELARDVEADPSEPKFSWEENPSEPKFGWEAARSRPTRTSSELQSTGAMVVGIVVISVGGTVAFNGAWFAALGTLLKSDIEFGAALFGAGVGSALLIGVPLTVWGSQPISSRAELQLTPGGIRLTGAF